MLITVGNKQEPHPLFTDTKIRAAEARYHPAQKKFSIKYQHPRRFAPPIVTFFSSAAPE